ncbi:MAG: DUF3352 domain-containing protein [Arachnia sp.]
MGSRNGTAQPGLPAAGPPNQGHPQQGPPNQGYPQQGAPNQGYPQQGPNNQGYQQQPPPGWGQQGATQQMGAPAKKKSRAPMIVAGALAFALVVGGIVFAMNFLGGATPAASEGIPSDALAILEVNLNPSVADKLAVKDFAEKFPAMAENVTDVDGDYKKAIYQAVFADIDEAPDYSQVEPWLGDSLAVAVLKSAAGAGDVFGSDPDVLMVVQVTDPAKAKAFMAEHGDGAQVAFLDDLMLVTDKDKPAPDVDAIKNAPLSDNDDYKADMAKLGGSWLLTGWGGAEAFKAIVAAGTESTGMNAEAPNARAAMGMKIEDGSAVVRAVSWSDQDVTEGPATTFLNSLPSAALGAMSFSLSDSVHDALWKQVEPLLAESPEAGEQLGISSKEDLRAILGSEMAIAVGMDQNNSPTVGIKVRTDDVAKHESFLDTLGNEMGVGGLEHVADGDVVTTTFGQPIDGFTNPGGTLAENETTQKLTKGSGDAQAVMWVDLPAILAIPGLGLDTDQEMMRNMEPLSGIGMSSSILGDDYAETFIRVGTK